MIAATTVVIMMTSIVVLIVITIKVLCKMLGVNDD